MFVVNIIISSIMNNTDRRKEARNNYIRGSNLE